MLGKYCAVLCIHNLCQLQWGIDYVGATFVFYDFLHQFIVICNKQQQLISVCISVKYALVRNSPFMYALDT
jgi:hypothetical protein